MELLESDVAAACCGLGLARAILALSFTVWGMIAPWGCAWWKLPDGSKLLVPLKLAPSAWKNVLHVYCYRDYEAYPGFTPGKNWRVLDVGGFIGVYSLRAARLVGEEGLVVYVEPVADHVAVASRSFEANALRNVRIVNRLVAGERGVRKLYVARSRPNSSVVEGYAEEVGLGVEEAVEVKCLTLEDLVRICGSRVDLVKLDVESAELEVLESSRRLLDEGVIERLVVEVHPPFVDSWEVAQVLEASGYEVLSYDPGLEYQAFIYAWKA